MSRALEVACPTCGSERGSPCNVSGGWAGTAEAFHLSRCRMADVFAHACEAHVRCAAGRPRSFFCSAARTLLACTSLLACGGSPFSNASDAPTAAEASSPPPDFPPDAFSVDAASATPEASGFGSDARAMDGSSPTSTDARTSGSDGAGTDGAPVDAGELVDVAQEHDTGGGRPEASSCSSPTVMCFPSCPAPFVGCAAPWPLNCVNTVCCEACP